MTRQLCSQCLAQSWHPRLSWCSHTNELWDPHCSVLAMAWALEGHRTDHNYCCSNVLICSLGCLCRLSSGEIKISVKQPVEWSILGRGWGWRHFWSALKFKINLDTQQTSHWLKRWGLGTFSQSLWWFLFFTVSLFLLLIKQSLACQFGLWKPVCFSQDTTKGDKTSRKTVRMLLGAMKIICVLTKRARTVI